MHNNGDIILPWNKSKIINGFHPILAQCSIYLCGDTVIGPSELPNNLTQYNIVFIRDINTTKFNSIASNDRPSDIFHEHHFHERTLGCIQVAQKINRTNHVIIVYTILNLVLSNILVFHDML